MATTVLRAGSRIRLRLSNSTRLCRSASSEAFSETLQFITNAKLRELEKRNEQFNDHSARVFSEAKEKEDNPVDKLAVLAEGMKEWPRGWSKNWSQADVERWIEQARHDPNVSDSVVQSWTSKAEAEFTHEKTRFKYAQLFGNLLKDWLKAPADSNGKRRFQLYLFEYISNTSYS